ncbi:SDR family NAD(P)-dependent oxidoreductase [Paraburkholderia lycopersici]|uniref:3-oxoacyl-[acyl-carrier protein] reductase n=1 Tax=Paraburkholderia lycopersici TaxID=416944 RepID=A0A1G6QWG8_9BURK|nr:3-oxoacyl-ACP reductase family protein [Paraburkholderia lycopersici]SDC96769.1 3-oxoacyl-[acyl-carrier protein] reductase [Paraburkholderia lycopersici]
MMQPAESFDPARDSAMTCLVTGAGSGIGRAIALAFARERAHVIVNDLPSSAALYELREDIEALGARCTIAAGDVADPECVRQLFAGIEWLDVLVNNAGILQESPVTEITDAAWDRMIKVHLYGAFHFSREAARLMKQQRHGAIVNIASDLGQLGCENLSHYSAAKGGIIAFTKSLARELAPHGARVNAVAPGGVLTPMVEALGDRYVEAEAARYPLKRLGTPDEIAEVVRFLSSDAASFMTGQIVGVNGGGVMNG